MMTLSRPMMVLSRGVGLIRAGDFVTGAGDFVTVLVAGVTAAPRAGVESTRATLSRSCAEPGPGFMVSGAGKEAVESASGFGDAHAAQTENTTIPQSANVSFIG